MFALHVAPSFVVVGIKTVKAKETVPGQFTAITGIAAVPTVVVVVVVVKHLVYP
jgi:hypothetical protein